MYDNLWKSTICNDRTEKLPITETFAKSVCRSQNLNFEYFMTAGLSSIFLFKVSLKIYGLLGSRSESLFPEAILSKYWSC